MNIIPKQHTNGQQVREKIKSLIIIHIPYDYTEVTNRFKGLDLIDRVPEELWTEVHDIVQKRRDQDHPQEK